MSLRFKGNVSIEKLSPRMVPALIAALQAFTDHGVDCWITSGDDGKHMPNSRHYVGLALDFRTNHISRIEARVIANKLKQHLSPVYDVLLEETHLHIEYDPK